jgi:hypothetical protein
VEQLVQERVLLSVPPQRNEREVLLSRSLLVSLEDHVVYIKFMKILEQFRILRGVWV